MRNFAGKCLASIMSFVFMFTLLPLGSVTTWAGTGTTTLTFTETGITETVSGSGYSITGTTAEITAPGTYKFTGSADEGSIVVGKNLSDVVIILEDLTLSSSSTAPLVVKKSSSATIHLNGTSTLTDNEDASTEETNEDFEGACIKIKSGSSVTFCGEGTLIACGEAKNAIKGGSLTSLTFNSGTYNITSANNAIAGDGNLTFNGGTYTIDSENDGIKSVPDADDTDSTGAILINGGSFTINSDGDAIQAEADLTINNGTFDITTLDGYTNTAAYDEDTMSCKGLKASGDRTDVSNNIKINGGTFTFNTVDDAVHSDGDISILGGAFEILTGDDGVHADQTLTLGSEDGLARDPEITINSSYEGLEAGNIYMYSGKYYVIASDDGVNAAGGSSSGTPGTPGGDSFRPGSNRPGGGTQPGSGTTTTSDYNIYIYGGTLYINCLGDGIDSNGGMYLYGGTQTVLSQGQGGDNSPLDADGTILLSGATVFGAGTNSMNEAPSSGSQSYYSGKTSYQANAVVAVSSSGSLIYNEKMVRNVNYIIYSSPDMTSSGSVSVSSASSLNACKSNAWMHSWSEGTEASGVITYTCSDCNTAELMTAPVVYETEACDGHESEEEPEVIPYTATFACGEGASVNVYYTQDYSVVSEENADSAAARDADSGAIDVTGNGQINFTVILDDGYELESVEASGNYKNIKGPSDTGAENTYRITKVTGDMVITVTTAKKVTGPIITTQPEDQYAEVGETVTLTAAATGEGTLSYQWQYSKDGGETWTTCTSSASKKKAFTFTMYAKYSGRYYRCLVTDANGQTTTASALVSLPIYDGITIEYQPVDQIVAAGKTASLYVSAKGNSLSYQWQYSKDGGTTWTNCTSSAGHTNWFTFKMYKSFIGRYYRCQLTDSDNNVLYTDSVMATCPSDAITITAQPEDLTAAAGAKVKLSVTAEGDSLSYQWQYTADNGRTWTTCTSSASKKSVFSFTMYSSFGGRYYRCQITDADGNIIYSDPALITAE